MYSIYIPGTEEHVKCKIIETDANAAVVLRPVVYNQPPDIIVALLRKPAICYSYLAAIMP